MFHLTSNILGPGISNDEKLEIYQDQFEYFSFNDHTIIAFVEGTQRVDEESMNRVITRDVTGRYAWDFNLFYRTTIPVPPADVNGHMKSENNIESITYIAESLKLRDGLSISSVPSRPKAPIPALVQQESQMPEWSGKDDHSDVLGRLLCYIGENNPDCLLDPSIPLNAPLPLSQPHSNIVMSMSEQLTNHLEFEKCPTLDDTIDM